MDHSTVKTLLVRGGSQQWCKHMGAWAADGGVEWASAVVIRCEENLHHAQAGHGDPPESVLSPPKLRPAFQKGERAWPKLICSACYALVFRDDCRELAVVTLLPDDR